MNEQTLSERLRDAVTRLIEFSRAEPDFVERYRKACEDAESVSCRAAELLDKLPRTADGVTIVPGMVVFCPCGHQHDFDSRFGLGIYCCNGSCWESGCQNDSGSGTHYAINKCYSTQAAASAAREEKT